LTTLALILPLFGDAPVGSARAAGQPPDRAAIAGIVNDALEAWKAPGVAVAVVYRGEVYYCEGHGVRELGRNQRVTRRTVFPLASCSKAFTTTALAMLVDEGKVHWDEPARRHVPFFRLADPLADANVTIRDLLSHRTGVAGHDLLWYRAKGSQEEIIRRIGLVPPSMSFRSGYQYQSIMVMAAGYAVGTASGSSWQAFVQKRILDPLGMGDTTLTTPPALRGPDHANGHRHNKAGKVEVVPWYPMVSPDPAGSVNSSAADLSKWLLFHLGEGGKARKLVSAAALEETHSPQTIMRLVGNDRDFQPFTHQMSYGMGWVVQDYRGQHLVAHGGSIDGFRSHLTLVPDARLGIALLNNLEGSQMNLAISNSLVDLFLGLSPQDWNGRFLETMKKEEAGKEEAIRHWQATRKKGTRTSRDLAAYGGSFQNPAYGTARIELKDGALAWQWSTFSGVLEHFHYDTFTARNRFLGDPMVVFRLDAKGEVVGMQFLNMDFRKAKP
jgi:CubicO group peptidase (beta-lactamase class C family)